MTPIGILDIEQESEDKKPDDLVTKESLISLVEEQYDRRMKERRPFELQWRLNLCFIEGQQFVEINPEGMTIDEMPKAYWHQEREPFNHIAPLYETRLARLSRMRPILKTRPGTNEQEDIRASKIGSAILKNIYYDKDVKNTVHSMLAWLEATGTAFGKNIWNPDKGPVVGYDVKEPDLYDVELDSEGDGFYSHMQRDVKEIREGDLEVVAISPFEILPDSSYRESIRQCRSLIHAKAYHIDDIEEIWGVTVPAEQSSTMRLHSAPIGSGGLGYGRGDFQFATINLDNHAILKEYWERPTKKFPHGRLIIVAGKKLLHYGMLPFPVDPNEEVGLPFVRCVSIERPGVFWGKCFVDRVIPLQRRYNAIKNRKAEFISRACIGSFAVEEGSVDEDDFEANASAPGYIAIYKRGRTRPSPLHSASLPAEFDKEEANLLAEFNIFSAVSDLTKQSKAPPGVKSGVALSLALEQDDTRLSLVVSNIEEFLVEMGKQWLRMYKNFVDISRTLREIGKNNIIELIDWTGADIRSDDVVIEAFSAIADSPAQRRQMIFDLLGTGLLFNPETGKIDVEMRAKIFEMIELGNWEASDNTSQLHISKADRENLGIIEGKMTYPVPYDDHILHIDTHNKFRLTTDYENMLAQNPMLEQMFQAHVDVHLMHIAPPEMQQQMAGVPQEGALPPEAGMGQSPPPEPMGMPMEGMPPEAMMAEGMPMEGLPPEMMGVPPEGEMY